jgi:20S proteasome alpha/beta subunit
MLILDRSTYRLSIPLASRKTGRYNKPMTIAVGFDCVDGIVLATDSQFTGGVGKTSGRKIFPICGNERHAVTIAGAGSAALTKRAVESFKDLIRVQIGDGSPSTEDLRNLLEDALCAVHDKHVYPAPPNERPVLDFWLLAAVWTPSGKALFRSDLTAVTPVMGRSCIGIGSYLGDYLTDLLWHNSPITTVDDVIPLAAYIIKSAKGYVDGCGLQTHIRTLRADGRDGAIELSEITDAEQFMESVFSALKIGLDGLTSIYAQGPNADAIAKSLVLWGGYFRDRQAARRVEQAKRDQFIRSAMQPNPQSPTADPSPQPPSPE